MSTLWSGEKTSVHSFNKIRTAAGKKLWGCTSPDKNRIIGTKPFVVVVGIQHWPATQISILATVGEGVAQTKGSQVPGEIPPAGPSQYTLHTTSHPGYRLLNTHYTPLHPSSHDTDFSIHITHHLPPWIQTSQYTLHTTPSRIQTSQYTLHTTPQFLPRFRLLNTHYTPQHT